MLIVSTMYNNKTNKSCESLAKQKVSFVFHSTKGLQRKTESFCIHVVTLFLENEAQIDTEIHVKTSQSARN